jgi:polar amino acid transport system substrate-binding protein
MGLNTWAHEVTDFKIFTFEIPQYVRSETEGEFIELTKLLFKHHSDLKFNVYPPARAYMAFDKSKNAILFPYLESTMKKKVLKTHAFYYKKDYLFYISQKPKKLNNSHLCITMGYPYDMNYIKRMKFKVTKAISDEACLKMLTKARVDYFLGEVLSGARAIINTQVKNIKFYKKPISSTPVYFAISDTLEGQSLLRNFNKELSNLRSSGKLKEIFNEAKQNLKNVLNIEYDPTNP